MCQFLQECVNSTKYKLLLKTQVEKGQATSHSTLAAADVLLSSHLGLFTNGTHVLCSSGFFQVLFGFLFVYFVCGFACESFLLSRDLWLKMLSVHECLKSAAILMMEILVLTQFFFICSIYRIKSSEQISSFLLEVYFYFTVVTFDKTEVFK